MDLASSIAATLSITNSERPISRHTDGAAIVHKQQHEVCKRWELSLNQESDLLALIQRTVRRCSCRGKWGTGAASFVVLQYQQFVGVPLSLQVNVIQKGQPAGCQWQRPFCQRFQLFHSLVAKEVDPMSAREWSTHDETEKETPIARGMPRMASIY
eukprot:1688367-Rhodomonas_salina.1